MSPVLLVVARIGACPGPPPLEVVREEPVVIGDVVAHASRPWAATAEGLHVVVRDGDRSWLELRSPAGVVRGLQLPELAGNRTLAVAVSGDEAVILYARWVGNGDPRLLRVDRRTGHRVGVEVSEPLPDLVPHPGEAPTSALVGDELVLAGNGDGIPGQLHLVSVTDGRVRSLDLPPPEDPQQTAAPLGVWADPTRPGSVLVAYDVQRIERPGRCEVHRKRFGRFVGRVDLATGTWETRRRRGHALGVTGDGRWVLRIASVLATLDARTGQLRVADGPPLADDVWPSLVIGDTIYDTATVDGVATWTPYRLGP